jgi:hypothetical protein
VKSLCAPGALLACICNAFSIIFLGLLRDARDDHLHGHGSKVGVLLSGQGTTQGHNLATLALTGVTCR